MTASALVLADTALERGEVPTVPHAGSPVLWAELTPTQFRFCVSLGGEPGWRELLDHDSDSDPQRVMANLANDLVNARDRGWK